MYRDSYVLIDTNIIKNNIEQIINHFNDYKYYIGVVKGNAYGHGMGVIKVMEKAGINMFAVATLEEALEVKKYTKKKILILEPVNIDYLDICSKNNFSITVSNFDYYKELLKLKIKLNIHIALNTGMNRLGIKDKNNLEEMYNYFINNKGNKNLHLEGLFSHFATTGILDDYYKKQLDNFYNLVENIDLKKIEIVHLGRSTTVENHEHIKGTNGIRLGAIMYGIRTGKINYSGVKGFLRKLKHEYKQSKLDIELIDSSKLDINYGFNIVAKVVDLQDVDYLDRVGYGATYQVPSDDKRIAIIEIGYSDGVDLRFKGMLVEINGKKYPVVGICMGMLLILVDNTIKLGDTVYVLKENVSEVARHVGTTTYAVMTNINRDLRREYKY